MEPPSKQVQQDSSLKSEQCLFSFELYYCRKTVNEYFLLVSDRNNNKNNSIIILKTKDYAKGNKWI